ncbi:MAG: hypothetical protein P4L16_00840 [Chlamydiales bacterium]|nr:hypothetical protein [Chlamydiales bacterium]
MSINDPSISGVEPSALQAEQAAAKKESSEDVRTAAMCANAAEALSPVVQTLTDFIQMRKTSEASVGEMPIPTIKLPDGYVETTQKAPFLIGTQKSLVVVKNAADTLANAVEGVIPHVSALVSLQSQLSQLITSTRSNQSVLTKAEETTLNQLQSDFTKTYSSIEQGIKQLPPNEPLTSALNKIVSIKLPPSSQDTSPIATNSGVWKTWQQFLNQLISQMGLSQPGSVLGSLIELSNKSGVSVNEKVLRQVDVNVPDDQSYTGIAGEIEKWIFGQAMQQIYAKVGVFQENIQKNAAFLNFLGPMEEADVTILNKILPASLHHFPKTPATKAQYTLWQNFWKGLSSGLKGMLHWRGSMENFLIELSGVAHGSPADPKLISMVNGMRNKFDQATKAIKFLYEINHDPAIVFTTKILSDGAQVVGSHVKLSMKDKLASVFSALNGFSNTLKNAGGSVQSTSTTDQSELQLQLNFMQEFMQAGPAIIQTLKGLMSAIAANLKGG